jgi:hypothetical protein
LFFFFVFETALYKMQRNTQHRSSLIIVVEKCGNTSYSHQNLKSCLGMNRMIKMLGAVDDTMQGENRVGEYFASVDDMVISPGGTWFCKHVWNR